MKSLTIGNREIGPGRPCFIIAEVGVNHNGDPDLALEMIDAVAAAGVDCVKFQTFHADEFMNSPDQFYEYRSQGKLVKESMLAMFKRLELKQEAFAVLFEHARKRGILALSTPTDRQAVDLLERIGTPAFKIGSDDIVYTPFIQHVAGKKKPVIISCGMANASDVDRAVDAVLSQGNDQLAILHCVSLYPTPPAEVNLRRISTLQAMYDFPIGYSDHTDGISACLGAVALGACLLEKHFTLDKNLSGPDHWFSADPHELKALVDQVRIMEAQLGHGRIWPSAGEREMASACRRSIIVARDLPSGHMLREEDLAFQRPGTGIMPYDLDKVLGRATLRPLLRGAMLTHADME